MRRFVARRQLIPFTVERIAATAGSALATTQFHYRTISNTHDAARTCVLRCVSRHSACGSHSLCFQCEDATRRARVQTRCAIRIEKTESVTIRPHYEDDRTHRMRRCSEASTLALLSSSSLLAISVILRLDRLIVSDRATDWLAGWLPR